MKYTRSPVAYHRRNYGLCTVVTGTPWVLEYVLEIRLTRPANKFEKQKRITLQPSGLSNYIRKTGGRLIRK